MSGPSLLIESTDSMIHFWGVTVSFVTAVELTCFIRVWTYFTPIQSTSNTNFMIVAMIAKTGGCSFIPQQELEKPGGWVDILWSTVQLYRPVTLLELGRNAPNIIDENNPRKRHPPKGRSRRGCSPPSSSHAEKMIVQLILLARLNFQICLPLIQ